MLVREPLQSSVDRCRHVVQPAEHRDLSVQVVGLDRTESPGEALPRRAATSAFAVHSPHAHQVTSPSGVLRFGGAVDSGGGETGVGFRPRRLHHLGSVPARKERLGRVAEVHAQLRVLPAHHVSPGDRGEARRRECVRKLAGEVVDTARVAADVEDPGRRRRVVTDDARFEMVGRAHHRYGVDVLESPERGPLVGDPVLQAHDRRARVGRAGKGNQGRLCVLALHSEEHDVPVPDTELDGITGDVELHGRRAVGVVEPQTGRAHGIEVGAPRDAGNLVTGDVQARRDRAADSAESVDHVPPPSHMEETTVVPIEYEKGLHQVGSRLWAWLQPDGGWGWSNAGLVAGQNEALLVDTLFDLNLTAAMLDAMRAQVPAASNIATVVNTHANGDHCYGNELVADARIIASTASAVEMEEVPPSLLAAMVAGAPSMGAMGDYVTAIFGSFSFDDIKLQPPTSTFDGTMSLDVEGMQIDLIEVGPAHTGGDVLAHLPGEGVVFTGDIVFNGGHPIIWADLPGWVKACDTLLELDATTVVPGHGPVGDAGIVRSLRQYLVDLEGEARTRFDKGIDPVSAARELHASMPDAWRTLGESERLVGNVAAAYRSFSDGEQGNLDVMTLFGAMAELAGAGSNPS